MSSAIKCGRCGKYSDVCRNGKIAFKSNVESIKSQGACFLHEMGPDLWKFARLIRKAMGS